MGLFQQVKKPSKLKAGIFGDTGTGKTVTASKIMIGLWKLCKSKKPIFFFDTEGGSGFVKDQLFDPAGVPVEACSSIAFNDLCDGLREAELSAFGVIIDQESRFWEEFRKQYLVDVNRRKGPNQFKQTSLSVGDWSILKPKWGQYNLLYLNTNIHIIKLGRSGNIFESSEEVVGGQKKTTFNKVGTKFKSESESGYEPSLLCEMEKVYNEGNGEYGRVLHVIKDRFGVIDSQSFPDPEFENVLPHIQRLEIAGTQPMIESKDSQIFDAQGDDILAARGRRRGILCEELAALIASYIPGMDANSKRIKGSIILKLFKVRAWKSVEDDWKAVPLELLEEVYKMRENNAPSIAEELCINERDKLAAGITE